MLTTIAILAFAQHPAAEGLVYVDASDVTCAIDPRFYGLFTEHIYDALDWRLAAQKVKGRGFESGDPDGDGVASPWRPVGSAAFALDTSTSYPRFENGRSSTSQRINLDGTGPAGIVQSNIAVAEGDAVTVSVFAKAEGNVTSVVVALADPNEERDEADVTTWPLLASADLGLPSADWRKRSAVLHPPRTVFPCDLLIMVSGTGTVWLDQVSAMPASAENGWRRDVIDLYRWLSPATLRYPGGNFCQTYRFADGLGDPDLRPVVPNPAWGNYPEPNNIGTDEFLRLCEATGMEPVICLNIGDTGGRNTLPGNSTELALREAVQWLEYCNGPPDSEWGAVRARNGHPEPYGVRLWEIGNEIGYGHIHGQLTAEQYVPKFREFAEALLRSDLSVEVVACGHDPGWNRLLYETAGELVDFISIHCYDSAGLPEDFMAHAATEFARWLHEHINAVREAGGEPTRVRLALNEWSYSWGSWGTQAHAVAAAGLLHECIRNADWVAMTNSSDSVVRFRNTEALAFPDAECLAIAILAHHVRGSVVRCDVAGPTFESNTRGAAVPCLDAVAARDGDRLAVSIINRGEAPVTARVCLDGVVSARGDGAWGIRAETIGAAQSFEEPEAVHITELPPPGDGLSVAYDLPARSVTVLVFRAEVAARAGTASVTGHCTPGARVVLMPVRDAAPTSVSADPEGQWRADVPAGAYRAHASAGDMATETGVLLAAPTGSSASLDLTPVPVSPRGPYDSFDEGPVDEARWTLTALEGSTGSAVARDGALIVNGARDSRYGALSAPLECADDEALVVEARVRGIEGWNALLHITREGHEGQFREFLEVGIENGRARAWAPNGSWGGSKIVPPATLRAAIGPTTASGRTVELSVNGELVQRVRDISWLSAARMRFFLYGWSDATTEWDWVAVRRLSVPRETLLDTDFSGPHLDGDLVSLGGAAVGTGRLEGERLVIEGAPDSRYGFLTAPFAQSSREALVVTAEVAAIEGHNALVSLVGDPTQPPTLFTEGGIERGRAQAWLDVWSRATFAASPPATLRLVAGPERVGLGRRVSVYVNDRFVSEGLYLRGRPAVLRVFLYGWGATRTEWNRLRVERVDLAALAGEMAAPEACVG